MTNEKSATVVQKAFDFSPPRPRPFLSKLPAGIDTYEEGMAQFFRWRTGLDYYATVDQIVDFMITTGRMKVLDLLTDTGALALRLAGRKAFQGRVYSFDSNVTLLERARQRARHLNLEQAIEFRHFEGTKVPVLDNFADLAVSVFDFHRHTAEQFLAEAARVLMPGGHLIVAEVLEPKSVRNTCKWWFKKLQLRYIHKNPAEAQGIYYDTEEMIQLLFNAGFRQVIIQELKARSSPRDSVYSLVAATK